MGLRTVLKQEPYLGLRIPVWARSLDARPEWRVHRFDLAIFQRQQELVLSGVAGDQARLHAKNLVEDARVEHRRRGCSGTAGDHLESLRILQRSDLRGAHEIYRHFGGWSSQPRKLGGVELRLLVGVERLERDRVLQETDD